MGKSNREKEIKIQIKGSNYNKVLRYLKSIIKNKNQVKGASWDIYWESPNKKTADFVRLRLHSATKGEITTKHSDKGTNLNRVEIDVPTSDPSQAYDFFYQLFGTPKGKIYKKYHVFFVNGSAISLYTVNKDLFIEIESSSVKTVMNIKNKLKKTLPFHNVVVDKSLYELYINS